VLEARGITKAFGSFKAVDDASVTVAADEVLGLIGPNGAGKSTFFNCLTGDLPPSAGTVWLEGADITQLPAERRAALGLARSFQVPLTFADMTVLDNVMVGAFLRTPHPGEARDRAAAVIERLEIARALATQPKILLLDEAMAGLNPPEVRQAIDLVGRIHADGITLVIVEHIMEVIITLAQRVVVFHQGQVIAAGSPREVMREARVVEAYLGKRAAAAAAAR